MTPASYEELVADVLSQFEKRDSGCRVLRDQKLRGTSGQVHQIDVVVEFEKLGVRFLTVIECKYWNQSVGVEPVMVLAQRMKDIGAQKGILVTKTGFQAGAYRLAESSGIALVRCEARAKWLVEQRGASPGSEASRLSPLIRSMYEGTYSYFRCSEGLDEHSALPVLAGSAK